MPPLPPEGAVLEGEVGADLLAPAAPASIAYTATQVSPPPEARRRSYGAQARQAMGPMRCDRNDVCARTTPTCCPAAPHTFTTCAHEAAGGSQG